MSGIKHDDNKARTDLLPADVLLSLAKQYTHGAGKYGDRNWESGLAYSRVYAALLRHLLAWWSGEDKDQEGFHHLDAVLFNAVALRAYTLRGMKEFDDRPISE